MDGLTIVYIAVVLLIFFLFEFLLFSISKKSPFICFKEELFPKISESLIEKFKAYDQELGWTNKKNTVKTEFSQGNEITYTYDERGSRSFEGFNYDSSLISTYGDSFCQGREVFDNETWQYYLSQKCSTSVLNFGVGNYGADQALLRLQREYPSNKSKTVIFSVTPYTITRISSIWKHFSEFENVLAFKPRFVLENDKLLLIKNLIDNKKKLLELEKYEDFFYQYDQHIPYFKEHIYCFPFTLSILRNSTPLQRTIYAKLISLYQKSNIRRVDYFAFQYFLPEIRYRKELFSANEDLLLKIIKEFRDYAYLNDFIPVFLMTPALEDVIYLKKTGDHYYQNICKQMKEELITLDFMDVLLEEKEVRNKYIHPIHGGHYNPSGNMLLADFLEKELKNLRIINI